MDERRRLFLDIETPPIPVWVFQLRDKSNANISHKNIITGYPDGIITICWKWAGKKAVHHLTWDKKQDDKKLIREIIPVLDASGEIVMHNGDRFDIPWIRGRAITHRIPMSPTYITNDTLKKSRQKFRWPSYRLDYMGRHLLDDEKLPTSMGLWTAIMERKCERSLRTMVRYCGQDVLLLEAVFNRIRPYIEPVTSIADFPRDCPECGGLCHKH